MRSAGAGALLAACCALAASSPAPGPARREFSPEIIEITAKGQLGREASLRCLMVPMSVEVTWLLNGSPLQADGEKVKVTNETHPLPDKDADGNQMMYRVSNIKIPKATAKSHGNYTCYVNSTNGKITQRHVILDLRIPATIAETTKSPLREKAGNAATLFCLFKGFGLQEVKWKKGNDMLKNFPPENQETRNLNETHILGTLNITDLVRKDNGTYLCGIYDPIVKKKIIGNIDVLVLERPQVNIDFVKAVGASRIYLKWTVNDGNERIESYTLQYRKNGTEAWTYYSHPVGGGNTSFVMEGLDPVTSYQLKISAKNSLGTSQVHTHPLWVKTLEKDPHFVPEIIIKGFTMSSVTIGWVPPSDEEAEFIQYYELVAQEKNNNSSTEKEAIHSGDYRNLPYMFDNLTPATTYIFKVRACSELTKICGNWSVPVNGSTFDGTAGPPTNVVVACQHDNISHSNFLMVSWEPPINPNGKIIRYNVELTGRASFLNEEGKRKNATWGPKIKYSQDTAKNARFDNLPPNTNYTIEVSGVTRTKRPGAVVTARCSTPPAPPAKDHLQRFRWDKVQEFDGRFMFKLHLPRITERNGAICCYRVLLVRLPQHHRVGDLPPPENMQVLSYYEAHTNKHGGAYVAEIFTSENFPQQSEVILGDSSSYNQANEKSLQQCRICAKSIPKRVIIKPTPIPPAITSPRIPITGTPKIEEKVESHIPNLNIADTVTTEKDIIMTTEPELINTEKNPPSLVESVGKDNLMDQPLVDDNRYALDEEYYMNRRISHQNKRNEQDDYPDDAKVVKEEYNGILKRVSRDTNTNNRFAIDKNSDNFDTTPSNPALTDAKSQNLISIDTMSEDWDQHVDDLATKDIDSDNWNTISQNRISRDTNFQHRVSTNTNADFLYMENIRRFSRQIGSSENFDRIMSEQSNGVELSEDKEKDRKELDVKILNLDSLERVEEGVVTTRLDKSQGIPVFDGSLDVESNYTGFIELIVHNDAEGPMMPVYSDYFSVLNPGPDVLPASEEDILELILKIVCGIVGLVLLVSIIACCIQHKQHKAGQQGVEMHPLHATLRHIYHGLKGGRHQLVTSAPPDMPPIARENLPAAFAERHADSDYGFQREFELLPDCFADRTTHQSEARENQSKNRYPDIKCYDQTRVKLSQMDALVGSDYINANYVMGYKERKKFICAQGPTDATVNDFWRMIWEQDLELVVMLTNLEEYSKVKCHKYWPDELRGQKAFGSITVQHVSQKRYSDYIVRELKISKQPTNPEGQPVVDNNGIKKNGGPEHSTSPGESQPSSPRDITKDQPNGTAPTERLVRQYHFLVWKDFVAPEYPQAILKFIKRINEAWSHLVGRPVVVHCSAGVGRTGTLVALDCLLEQLKSEGQVSVFNTVAELRRQRNFLVQSLKQYIFVYRALVEYATYGDTEVTASKLKSSVDRLRNTPEGAGKCLMEEQFQRMISTPLSEPVKSTAAGASEEVRAKNRSDACLPYDTNRVILSPVPGSDYSTYINASFIEGYDNSESYIITQDPLPGTIADFWRLVSEQGVATIVMLSELGDGDKKCPRYWDDGGVQYEHIAVQYQQSESCPYYTKREFLVTNTKSGDMSVVRQLQYHGWPTVSGQVPEVTRGLAELADAADSTTNGTPAINQGPMLVHCNLGTERSSMFVALCILICQLRTERRVDVCSVARKVRSQRANTLTTFLQYEFLHRAILNYAELHNLLEDS